MGAVGGWFSREDPSTDIFRGALGGLAGISERRDILAMRDLLQDLYDHIGNNANARRGLLRGTDMTIASSGGYYTLRHCKLRNSGKRPRGAIPLLPYCLAVILAMSVTPCQVVGENLRTILNTNPASGKRAIACLDRMHGILDRRLCRK